MNLQMALGIIVFISDAVRGDVFVPTVVDKGCGTWTPFVDGKCFKILSSKHRKDEGEALCQNLAEDSEIIPSLLSIKNKNEQDFITKLLFDEYGVSHGVWLQLHEHYKENGFSLQRDEAPFENWAEHNATVEDYKQCVVMASNESWPNYNSGQWIAVDCNTEYGVVCQKTLKVKLTKLEKQVDQLETLVHSLITQNTNSAHSVTTGNVNEIAELKVKYETANEEIKRLKYQNEAAAMTISLLMKRKEENEGFYQVSRRNDMKQLNAMMQNTEHVVSSEHSPCGDWSPYKDEQCIKIIENGIFLTKLEAEKMCQSVAAENGETSNLVTIKTKEKQKFLEHHLFVSNAVANNVWLGLDLGEKWCFRWHDGEELNYTNWQRKKKCDNAGGEQLNIATKGCEHAIENNHTCVQLEAGEGIYPPGIWLQANCKTKNVVVCEKRQILSTSSLHAIILEFKEEFSKYKDVVKREISSFKLESERNLATAKQEAYKKSAALKEKIEAVRNEAEKNTSTVQNHVVENIQTINQKLDTLKRKDLLTDAIDYKEISELKMDLNNLRQNPVPVGFLYVQFPDQLSPTNLWPGPRWKDITSEYAGLFFRAEGGGSEPFGSKTEQSDNTRRVYDIVTDLGVNEDNNQMVPSNGAWSKYRWTGSEAGGSRLALRFRMTTGEVRPRNKAVKIWQRVR